jgi:hypothetical protein
MKINRAVAKPIQFLKNEVKFKIPKNKKDATVQVYLNSIKLGQITGKKYAKKYVRAGYVQLNMENKILDIGSFYPTGYFKGKTYKHRNVGNEVLKKIIKFGKKEGMQRVDVTPTRKSFDFYQKMGFYTGFWKWLTLPKTKKAALGIVENAFYKVGKKEEKYFKEIKGKIKNARTINEVDKIISKIHDFQRSYYLKKQQSK